MNADAAAALLNSIRSACPARIRIVAHRVTLCARAAERGSLRVLLDGSLVGEWALSGMRWETAAYLGPDGRAVERAVKRVLKK